MDKIVDVMGMIVGVALVTTLVAHPNTANVVKAFGGSFTSSVLAAQGIR
ncbi:MAG TPA: hypothetical protein VFI54_06335 [Solirubrobacteraceae bacterium]|nr:hypothetical protein [Solirubrobacteraceae bacterium]